MAASDPFGNFAQGIASGLGTGVQLGQRNRLIELQEKQAEQESLSNFASNVAKFSQMPEALRKSIGPHILKTMEKAFGVPLDESIKSSLIKGDDAEMAAVYRFIAEQIKLKRRPEEIAGSLSAQPGDLKKKLEILEQVYGKFYKPAEELDLQKKSVAIQGQNAATSAYNAQTTRMAAQKEIITGEIFRDTDATLKKGEPLSPVQLDRARMAGINMGLKADEALNFQVNDALPGLGIKAGQTVLAFRDKSTGQIFVRTPEGKTVQIPSTLGIEVGKPTPDPRTKVDTFTLNQDYDTGKGIIGKGERITGTVSPDGKKIKTSIPDADGKTQEIEIDIGAAVKTTVQTGSAAPEGGEAKSRLKNQQDAVDLGIKDTVALQKLVEGGMRTGTASGWQRFLQSSVGQSKQFVEMLGVVRKDAAARLDPAEYQKMFDPKLPTAQVIENALVYRYASTLAPGNERVPVEVLRQVRERIGLTEGWANDPKTAQAKLAQVLRELSQTRQTISKRLKEDTRSPLRKGADFDATKE